MISGSSGVCQLRPDLRRNNRIRNLFVLETFQTLDRTRFRIARICPSRRRPTVFCEGVRPDLEEEERVWHESRNLSPQPSQVERWPTSSIFVARAFVVFDRLQIRRPQRRSSFRVGRIVWSVEDGSAGTKERRFQLLREVKRCTSTCTRAGRTSLSGDLL